MTAVCPNGHVSADLEWCDQCGARMVVAVGPTVVLPAVEEMDTSPAVLRAPCPSCGAPRSGDDRYCEGCGHDFLTAPETVVWEALASADRAQFDRLAPSGLSFPAGSGERRFMLTEAAMRIGRSRGGSASSAPEIDLAGEPEDPGISRLHAVLERQADGSYAVRDLGSTNGTTVNDSGSAVGTDVAVPLGDGDRIRLGAWTTITLRKR
jgi:hypothetical protein